MHILFLSVTTCILTVNALVAVCTAYCTTNCYVHNTLHYITYEINVQKLSIQLYYIDRSLLLQPIDVALAATSNL